MKVDAVWDCAVLELMGQPEGVEPAEVELGNEAMQQEGNRLESCGYGPDGKLACNSGLFLGYRRSTEAPAGPDDWMVISGHARGGDSGGPVFNQRGRLVGVLWGTDGQEVVCVQAGRIHALLDAAVPAAKTIVAERKSLQGILQRAHDAAQATHGRGIDGWHGRVLPRRRVGPAGLFAQAFRRTQAARAAECDRPARSRDAAGFGQHRRQSWRVDRATSAAQADQEAANSEPSPLVAGLCMFGAAAVGFVIYFATQKN